MDLMISYSISFLVDNFGLVMYLSSLKIWKYFSQLIACPVIGGVFVRDKFDIFSKIGLRSDEKSFRFVTCTTRGILTKVISSISGLYSGEAGKCVGESGAIIE